MTDFSTFNLGFLASHNGTDMQGIVKAAKSGEINGTAAVVISNNSKSPALDFARGEKIPHAHISQIKYADVDRAIADKLRQHNVNLVILSGYMKQIGPQTNKAFPGRILNVHPSLLPDFGGLYDEAVHKAVLKAKRAKTGPTIHTIGDSEEYDTGGKILWQSEVPVLEDDTVQSLKKRVQQEEIRAFIKLLKEIQSGKISL